MSWTEGLEPKRVFERFDEINQIPRGSGDEARISAHLLQTGRALGLEAHQDDVGNVVIRRPASAGYENAPRVTLQGHMDMVCQKTADSDHDFSRDPIAMYVDGQWLRAKDTTLGADDGIGVAMALALLEEDWIHPPLEVLVTTSEETGMDGAIGLDPAFLSGKMLINIDSEEEGYVTAACAGGSTGEVMLPLERTDKEGLTTFLLRVDGMRGGHSGMEILEVNNSALKVMGEFLRKIDVEERFHLISFHSGDKHNAIPNAAEAVVAVSAGREDAFLEASERVQASILRGILKYEPDIRFHCEVAERQERPLTDASKTSLLTIIQLMPHGVNTMMANREVVESSDNLASAHTSENALSMILSVRSSSKERLEELQKKIAEIAQTCGAQCDFRDGYPAWEYAEHSELRDLFCEQYQALTGKPMEVLVIHAGLECALFAKSHPGVDMVSFGPDVFGAHTTKESLSIPSVGRSYELLKAVLTEIALRNRDV